MSKSFDEMAAEVAGQMLAKSGAGDMPQGRGGDSGAEGGFTSQAGGTVIDSAAKSDDADADEDADDMNKAAKTGAAMNSEPGRSGEAPKTGAAITSAGGREEGGGAGEGGNLAQTGDEMARGRKSGKVGISKGVEIEDEDEDEDEEKSCKKSDPSDVDAEALIKSLDELEAIAMGSTIAATPDRRAELGEKLAAGELTKSEMVELHELTKAAVADGDEDFAKSDVELEDEPEFDETDFAKSFQERFADDEYMQEAYDASELVERTSQMTAAAIDEVREGLHKSLGDHVDRTQRFNVQLAKSLRGMTQLASQQGQLIKSLADRLEQVENTPLPRRGVTGVQALNKSMPGEVGGGDQQISREDVVDTLIDMVSKGMERTPNGHVIDTAVSMIESGAPIQKSLLNDVISFKSNQRANVQ